MEKPPAHLMAAADIPRPPFLSENDWAQLDKAARLFWTQVAADAEWLIQQPQFRRFAFAWMDEPRFCGVWASTHRSDDRATTYLNGKRDSGLALQQLLQAVAPKLWMRLLHEGFNARAALPTLDEPEEEK